MTPDTPPFPPHDEDPSARICRQIWELEHTLGLFNLRIQGIHIWKFLRMAIYLHITKNTGVFGEAHPATAKPPGVVNIVLHVLWHSIWHNPYWRRRPRRYIVMPSGRMLDGRDLYNDTLLRQLPRHETLILYNHWRSDQYPGSFNLTYTILLEQVRHRLRIKPAITPTAEERVMLASVEQAFEKTFGYRVPIQSLALYGLQRFHRHFRAMEKLLKRFQPEYLYVTTSYGMEAAIHAAHEKGIPVYELQHGILSPFHLGYSYPGWPDVPYLPDKILCMGPGWLDGISLPAVTQSAVIGSDYMRAFRHTATRDDKHVLVLSQGTIGAALLKIVAETALLLPDYRFTFRLHPSERLHIYRNQLEQMARLPANLKLSCHKTGPGTDGDNSYALMNKASHVVGVYSTALFEAMSMGCRVLLVALPGISHMRHAIARKDALLAHDAHELARLLPQAAPCTSLEYYYAPPVENIHHTATLDVALETAGMAGVSPC